MPHTDKSKILLIDDDKSLLVTLRDFLQFEGYEVVTASGGQEGLDRLRDVTPDLIVLDMSMPGMDGMGFLERITQDGRPRYPVLVLTAKSQMAEYFGSVAVDGFVAKPCDPNDLLMEISRIVFLTRGKPRQDAAGRATPRRTVLLGEADDGASRLLAEAFGSGGYLVSAVATGAELLEKAILERPDVIVLSRSIAMADEGAVGRMLSEMPHVRKMPIVFYGCTADGSMPDTGGETAAARRRVAGSEANAVLAAIDAVLAG